MNKNKETLLKILIVSSIYTVILGFHSLVHKGNFNEDKFRDNKKAKVVKLVKKDNFNTFMKKVKDGEIKRVAEKKAKIEKQKQVELKRILVEKKKAKEKAERKLAQQKVMIAKKNKINEHITLSRGGNGSNENTNYDTTFALSFYTSLNCLITSSGAVAKNGMCANNVIKQGSNIVLEGYGIQRVMDSGGDNFNSSNRLDIFVERNNGESDSEYNNRVEKMGMVTVRGFIIK